MKRLYLTTSLIIARIALGAVPALAASSEPLIVQDQGSFTAGGTVATAPGTFDPRKHENVAVFPEMPGSLPDEISTPKLGCQANIALLYN